MSSSVQRSAGDGGQAGTNDYDAFAEAYAAESESNLINGYYTRPAVLDLAGEVAGRRILDVGCGAGPLLESLRDRGALVSGVEPSAKMLELCRRRLGDGAELHQGGLGGGNALPFDDGTFDDVIACLVLHYLKDWAAPLAELRRVLVPGGRLIVANNHPFVYKLAYPDADYFAQREFAEDYTFAGQPAVLTYWHRPLSAMIAAFTAAGFRVTVISEPPAAPGARERFPDTFAEIFKSDPSRTAFLGFLFLVLEAV